MKKIAGYLAAVQDKSTEFWLGDFLTGLICQSPDLTLAANSLLSMSSQTANETKAQAFGNFIGHVAVAAGKSQLRRKRILRKIKKLRLL